MPQQIFNIPNTLTSFRILLIPVFVMSLAKGNYGLALIFFSAAAITDLLDGFAARYWNQKTLLGTILDPIADKLLVATAFITMTILGWLPLWLMGIILLRDVVIGLGMGYLYIKQISVHLSPSLISKFTTTFQLLTVVFALTAKVWSLPWPQAWIWMITAVLTLLSGMHYVYVGVADGTGPDTGITTHALIVNISYHIIPLLVFGIFI